MSMKLTNVLLVCTGWGWWGLTLAISVGIKNKAVVGTVWRLFFYLSTLPVLLRCLNET